MGNYKFRFSDMIPNAWFHKLKNMNKPRSNYPKTLNHSNKKHPPSHNHTSEFTNSDQRKSYYFTRDLSFQPDSPTKPTLPVAEPPRKSSRRRRSTKRNRPRPPPRLVTSSVSAGCSCGATVESVWAKPDDSSPSPEECTNSGPDQSSSSEPDSVLTEYGSDRGSGHDSMLSWSSPCKCGAKNDIIIDIENNGCRGGGEDQFRRLPPIITKQNEQAKVQRTSAEFSETNAYGSLSVKVVKEDFLSSAASPVKRFPAKSPGMRLRVNSPRIANRRIQGRRSVSSNSSSAASRRSISDSFAVVKASKDPRRDFRESMVEMILENNIRAKNDLEELLACYLSLNSDEYHDLIINVFKQIWFDFIHLRLS